MPSDYKLSYFAIMGLAEPIRFLLKYGGIEFEDDRISFEQWAEIKKNITFGQVPLLTVKGRRYNQNLAIARFIAKEVKLNGKDDLEDLEIDGIIDTITDFRTKIEAIHYDSDIDEATKIAKKQQFVKESVPYYLGRLDKIVQDNKGHLACKKLTWADLYFVAVMYLINYHAGTDVISKYDHLKKLKTSVLAIPAIKKWTETRPKTDY